MSNVNGFVNVTDGGPYALYPHKFIEEDAIGDNRYALDVGGPGVDLLRSAANVMQEASRIRLEKEISGEADLLQYGSSMGDPTYRTNLAKFLSEHYNDVVDPFSLFTTPGATHGLSLIAGTFFKSERDYIFIEDPTYFQVSRIVGRDLGLKTVPIPVVDDGMDLDLLQKAIECRKPTEFRPTTERPYWALLYVIPIYQNPTGLCYSADKCEGIIKLARQHKLLVICDDVYNVLCFAKNGDTFEKAPPRLFQYDAKTDDDYYGNVVSNGSFSKLLGPGLRLGWFEAPEIVLKRLLSHGCVIGGGCMNHYTSGIVGSVLNTELFSDYITMVRNTGKRKLDAVVDVLQKNCPRTVKYCIPKGGYFIWMELPASVDVKELNEHCQKTYNISFHHGLKCSTSGKYQNCMRICFMYYSIEQLVYAVTKIVMEINTRLRNSDSL